VPGGDELVSALTSLFALSRLVASCSHPGTLRAVAVALLHPTLPHGCWRGRGRGGTLLANSLEGWGQDDAAPGEVPHHRDNPYRRAVLAALRGVDVADSIDGTEMEGVGAESAGRREDLAAAAATLLATLLKARHLDEATLEAGGALPARRRRTKVGKGVSAWELVDIRPGGQHRWLLPRDPDEPSWGAKTWNVAASSSLLSRVS